MTYCGDYGYKTKTGEPCKQVVSGERREPCVWHKLKTPEERSAFAKIGSQVKKRMQEIPNLQIHQLDTDEGISNTLQSLCEVAAHKHVDLRRLSEVRQALNVAVALQQTKATRELNRTLMKLEHGEKAVLILDQLKGERTMRKLPSRKTEEEPDGEHGED